MPATAYLITYQDQGERHIIECRAVCPKQARAKARKDALDWLEGTDGWRSAKGRDYRVQVRDARR